MPVGLEEEFEEELELELELLPVPVTGVFKLFRELLMDPINDSGAATDLSSEAARSFRPAAHTSRRPGALVTVSLSGASERLEERSWPEPWQRWKLAAGPGLL